MCARNTLTILEVSDSMAEYFWTCFYRNIASFFQNFRSIGFIISRKFWRNLYLFIHRAFLFGWLCSPAKPSSRPLTMVLLAFGYCAKHRLCGMIERIAIYLIELSQRPLAIYLYLEGIGWGRALCFSWWGFWCVDWRCTLLLLLVC